MAVWKGFGLLTAFIAASMIAAVGFLAQLIGIEEAYRNWPEAVALLLSGIVVWFLGRALHSTSGHEAAWPRSADALPLQDAFPPDAARHSLLFIRMEYWGPIFFAAGIIALFI